MKATGLRDKAVTIQQRTITKGASGFPVETFADAPPAVWMSREPAQTFDRGAEDLRGGAAQVSARGYHKWTTLYVPILDPDLVDVPRDRRLLYMGRTFDIVDAQRSANRGEVVLITLAKTG